jgi:hypothetical protein
MYQGIQTQQSCARAWVAGCTSIISTGDEGYNIVIDVTDPTNHDDKDNEVITLVNRFLKLHNKNPIITVLTSRLMPNDPALPSSLNLISIVASDRL